MSLHKRCLKLMGTLPARESAWIVTDDFAECFAHLGTIRIPLDVGRLLGLPENGEVVMFPVAVDQPGRAPIPVGEFVVIAAEDCFFGMVCRGTQAADPILGVASLAPPPPQGLFVASAFRVRFENPSAEPIVVRATINATVTDPVRPAKETARESKDPNPKPPPRHGTPPRGRARVG